MSKHTPGPWDDASKYPDIQSVRIFAGCHYIGSIGNSDDTREQTEANAALIAAAPDLLRELKHLVSLMEPVEDTLNIPGLATLNGARAAITKAEGGAK